MRSSRSFDALMLGPGGLAVLPPPCTQLAADIAPRKRVRGSAEEWRRHADAWRREEDGLMSASNGAQRECESAWARI